MYRSTHLARSVMNHIRRTPAPRSYSSALDPAGINPKEDLMLDATAWILAISLVYLPDGDFDDVDCHNISDLQDEAKKQTKKEKDDPKSNHH